MRIFMSVLLPPTATTSILAATLPLGIMLVTPAGPITLAAAAVAGALLLPAAYLAGRALRAVRPNDR